MMSLKTLSYFDQAGMSPKSSESNIQAQAIYDILDYWSAIFTSKLEAVYNDLSQKFKCKRAETVEPLKELNENAMKREIEELEDEMLVKLCERRDISEAIEYFGCRYANNIEHEKSNIYLLLDVWDDVCNNLLKKIGCIFGSTLDTGWKKTSLSCNETCD